MSKENHIQKLREKHERIDITLESEQKRPCPDKDIISTLKQQKLKIKDEIYMFEERELV